MVTGPKEELQVMEKEHVAKCSEILKFRQHKELSEAYKDQYC